ncbi:MAG: hypothetical protein HZR80_06515 [Candidatus Heimdallarchaeota archaeon]
MTGHTQIRYSWYIPLPQVYTHEDILNPDFNWIMKKKLTKDEIKNNQAVIQNFTKLRFDKTITFPLLIKDNQIRILKEIPFAPIYFTTTEQKKITYEKFESDQFTTKLINEKIDSVKFSIQLYPVGFGVISSYVNFASIIDPDLCAHFVNKFKCGRKNTIMTKYVRYLKLLLLKNLFREKELRMIKTICKGPKIRVNFIDDHLTTQRFTKYSEKILGSRNSDTNILYRINKKTNDQIAFHKKGLTIFTETSLSKNKRSYFRKSLDFIMDIVFGSSVLLPLIPSAITKADSQNKYGRIMELIFTSLFSINPKILGSRNELISLLPTAGMRTLYRKFEEICNYSKDFELYTNQIIERINEMRVDKWYELITTLLKENIPIITEKLFEALKERDYTTRDVITPQIQLDTGNKKIIDFLLEKLVSDYSNRFGFSANTQLSKDILGFCTINVIEKALGITGRNHLEFKNRLDLLRQVGFLEAIAYEGPGSRKDSVQYRTSPKHPYIDSYVRIRLAKESISDLKII